MALQVWLPLNGDLTNNGVGNPTLSADGATVDNSGKLGKCYSFNGSTSCINITYSEIPNILNGDFSICMWLYHNDNSDRSILFGSYSLTGGFFNLEKQTNNKIRFYWNGNPDYNPQYSTLTPQQWNHIVITRKGNLISVYINGLLTDQATYTLSTVPSTNVNYRLGRDARSDYTALKGKMNDFRLYSHALSPKEVEILARGLVLHYPMEGANNTLLPIGYQQLDYIEGTGASYFNTNYYFNPETDSCKVTYKANTSHNGMILADSGAKYFWIYYYNATSSLDLYADNGSGQKRVAGGAYDQNIHTVEYKSKHLYVDNTDKGSLTATYTQDTNTMWLFAYAANSYVFKGRIYNVYIERNEKPQRCYIPAKRISDSAIGMYDVVNNTFTVSANTAFTAGSVVGSPSIYYDVSGYKYNGTITGNVSYSSDSARYSVSTEFSKAGYINVPSFNVDTSAFTLNFWVKMKTATSQHFVLGTFTSWTGNGIGVYRDTNGINYQCIIRSAGESKYGGLVLPLTIGSWYMLTLTYDGIHYKGYLNGILKQNVTYGSGGVVSNPVFMVGNSKFNNTPASENEEAFVSDVRFYATALSAAQVAELYNTAISISNNGTLMGYELIEN